MENIIYSYYCNLKTPVFFCKDGEIAWHNMSAKSFFENEGFRSYIEKIVPGEEEKVEDF